MSECSEIGHLYRLFEYEKELSWGCTRGCGDIVPFESLPAVEKVEVLLIEIGLLEEERDFLREALKCQKKEKALDSIAE